MPQLDSGNLERLRTAVLGWYRRHGRTLPWRGDNDPYTVLISEIMLQQTQVNRVLVKLPLFLAAFPSMKDLSKAPQRAVVSAWRGMGYNNRAVRLHRLSRLVMERHRGRLPVNAEELRTLPGVGRYTSHAILAFAFRKPVPVVDVNVRRLLSRLFWRLPDTGSVRPENEIWSLAGLILPDRRQYDWNQALMDLGATVCTARSPRCTDCPVVRLCRSAGKMKPRSAASSRTESLRHGLPNRIHRGHIIDTLRGRKRPLPLTLLGPMLTPRFSAADVSWLSALVQALERDGLVTVKPGQPGVLRVSLA